MTSFQKKLKSILTSDSLGEYKSVSPVKIKYVMKKYFRTKKDQKTDRLSSYIYHSSLFPSVINLHANSIVRKKKDAKQYKMLVEYAKGIGCFIVCNSNYIYGLSDQIKNKNEVVVKRAKLIVDEVQCLAVHCGNVPFPRVYLLADMKFYILDLHICSNDNNDVQYTFKLVKKFRFRKKVGMSPKIINPKGKLAQLIILKTRNKNSLWIVKNESAKQIDLQTYESFVLDKKYGTKILDVLNLPNFMLFSTPKGVFKCKYDDFSIEKFCDVSNAVKMETHRHYLMIASGVFTRLYDIRNPCVPIIDCNVLGIDPVCCKLFSFEGQIILVVCYENNDVNIYRVVERNERLYGHPITYQMGEKLNKIISVEYKIEEEEEEDDDDDDDEEEEPEDRNKNKADERCFWLFFCTDDNGLKGVHKWKFLETNSKEKYRNSFLIENKELGDIVEGNDDDDDEIEMEKFDDEIYQNLVVPEKIEKHMNKLQRDMYVEFFQKKKSQKNTVENLFESLENEDEDDSKEVSNLVRRKSISRKAKSRKKKGFYSTMENNEDDVRKSRIGRESDEEFDVELEGVDDEKPLWSDDENEPEKKKQKKKKTKGKKEKEENESDESENEIKKKKKTKAKEKEENKSSEQENEKKKKKKKKEKKTKEKEENESSEQENEKKKKSEKKTKEKEENESNEENVTKKKEKKKAKNENDDLRKGKKTKDKEKKKKGEEEESSKKDDFEKNGMKKVDPSSLSEQEKINPDEIETEMDIDVREEDEKETEEKKNSNKNEIKVDNNNENVLLEKEEKMKAVDEEIEKERVKLKLKLKSKSKNGDGRKKKKSKMKVISSSESSSDEEEDGDAKMRDFVATQDMDEVEKFQENEEKEKGEEKEANERYRKEKREKSVFSSDSSSSEEEEDKKKTPKVKKTGPKWIKKEKTIDDIFDTLGKEEEEFEKEEDDDDDDVVMEDGNQNLTQTSSGGDILSQLENIFSSQNIGNSSEEDEKDDFFNGI